MTEQKQPTLILSRPVWERMFIRTKEAGGRYEVGGLLIGRVDDDVATALGLTEPSRRSGRGRGSFTLDGAYHERMARRAMDQRGAPVGVIGMWHSHGCLPLVFSEQDGAAHALLSRAIGGSVSLLCVYDGTLRLRAVWRDESGDAPSPLLVRTGA